MRKRMGTTKDGRAIDVIHDAGPSYGGLYYIYTEEYPGSHFWVKGAPYSTESAAVVAAQDLVGR